jgi:hypothetical protein
VLAGSRICSGIEVPDPAIDGRHSAMTLADTLAPPTSSKSAPPAARPVEVRNAAPPAWLAMPVGLAAIGFSVVYFASDILEVGQGGHFSAVRLALTYAGEAAIPLFVLGLYAVRRPRIGRLGLFGAVAYAYAYVFFTSTVVYALVARTPDYEAVTKEFGAWMVVHGLIGPGCYLGGPESASRWGRTRRRRVGAPCPCAGHRRSCSGGRIHRDGISAASRIRQIPRLRTPGDTTARRGR